jgi:hypothetical protein
VEPLRGDRLGVEDLAHAAEVVSECAGDVLDLVGSDVIAVFRSQRCPEEHGDRDHGGHDQHGEDREHSRDLLRR